MKNRRKAFTYFVAAAAILVVSATWSSATQPLQPPQNFTGKLTHGVFTSCSGQILDPPAYAVDGTFVLHIDRMTEAQVPPPAQLTMVVFRNSDKYLLFPNIELTPVSLADGIYTYTFGPQVTLTLDTNTSPATFSWHVEFSDGCTLRAYRSLSYIGFENGGD